MKNMPKQVVGSLFRSSAPTSKEDLNLLWDIGIRNIICLQEGWSWAFGSYRAEKDWEDKGGTYLLIGWSSIFPPTSDEIDILLRRIDPVEGKWLIHCKAGVDRTGMLCGAFLVKHGHRNPQEAWEYIGENGMHWWYRLLWKRAWFRIAEKIWLSH